MIIRWLGCVSPEANHRDEHTRQDESENQVERRPLLRSVRMARKKKRDGSEGLPERPGSLSCFATLVVKLDAPKATTRTATSDVMTESPRHEARTSNFGSGMTYWTALRTFPDFVRSR